MKTINGFFWWILAMFLARPAVASYLVRRAKRNPYCHLRNPDGTLYMARWWLFNPYSRVNNLPTAAISFRVCGKGFRFVFPFSVRVHFIASPDSGRDMHDHPWNARTVILKGWYREERKGVGRFAERYLRDRGDTALIGFEQYHRITEICAEGVYTLFISSPWAGDWGFFSEGRKVYWRGYLGTPAGAPVQLDTSTNPDNPERLRLERVMAIARAEQEASK